MSPGTSARTPIRTPTATLTGSDARLGRRWRIAGTRASSGATTTTGTRSTTLPSSKTQMRCAAIPYYSLVTDQTKKCSAFSVTTTSTSEYIDVPGRDCDSIWSANVLAYAYPASATTATSACPLASTRERLRGCGRARSPTQPSSPTSPAQALLHPWRLLRSRTSHATFAGAGTSTRSLQRRASRAASMFTKLSRLGSRDDGESWIYVEVVHTITQRPLRDCEW